MAPTNNNAINITIIPTKKGAGTPENKTTVQYQDPATSPAIPANAASIAANSVTGNQAGVIFMGTVKRTNPGLYTYEVMGVNNPSLPCGELSSGPYSYSNYPVGTSVLVWKQTPQAAVGVILGAIPTNDVLWASPVKSIVEGRLNGPGVDSAHTTYANGIIEQLQTLLSKGIASCLSLYNYNNGKPYDIIDGDWGSLNEFKVGLHAGKFTARLMGGMSEVTASYLDNSVSVLAHKTSTETLTTDEKHFCDQGEGSTVKYMTPYLWEGLGSSTPASSGAIDSREVTTTPYMQMEASSLRAGFEPHTLQQTGIFRYMELTGFLGDLLHQWVAVPKVTGNVVSRDDEKKWPGVYEHFVGIDGFTAIRTAKGLLLEKTNLIAVPEEKKDPWDPEGDKDEDCDYGKTPYEESEYEYEWGNESETTPRLRPLLAQDYLAFVSGIASVRHLIDHSKDWSIPEEVDSSITDEASSPVAEALGKTYQVTTPTPTKVKVDHRRTVKYYPVKSYVLMSDDGNIVAQNAYGVGYSLVGANLELTAPGDIILRPGRRVVAMAPQDIIMRSGRNVDVSAGIGNVRVKAEKNVMVLAGNGGTGGVLLESKGTGSSFSVDKPGDEVELSGVVIKALDSCVATYGGEVYMSAAMGEKLTLEAPEGDLRLTGSVIQSVASKELETAVGDVGAFNSYAKQSADGFTALIGSAGKMFSESGLILTSGGITVSGQISASDGFYSPTTEVITVNTSQLERITTRELKAAQDEKSVSELSFTRFDETTRDADKGLGGMNLSKNIGFSFNSTEQFGLEDFSLVETPWQLRYKAAGVGSKWSEPVITTVLPDGTTAESYPWPGKEAWSVDAAYVTIDSNSLNNIDIETQAGKLRNRAETAAPEATVVTMESSYVVDLQE